MEVDGCCLFSLKNSVDYGSRYGSLRECLWNGDWGGFAFSGPGSISSRG